MYLLFPHLPEQSHVLQLKVNQLCFCCDCTDLDHLIQGQSTLALGSWKIKYPKILQNSDRWKLINTVTTTPTAFCARVLVVGVGVTLPLSKFNAFAAPMSNELNTVVKSFNHGGIERCRLLPLHFCAAVTIATYRKLLIE